MVDKRRRGTGVVSCLRTFYDQKLSGDPSVERRLERTPRSAFYFHAERPNDRAIGLHESYPLIVYRRYCFRVTFKSPEISRRRL